VKRKKEIKRMNKLEAQFVIGALKAGLNSDWNAPKSEKKSIDDAMNIGSNIN
jgi:hypothetical protein